MGPMVSRSTRGSSTLLAFAALCALGCGRSPDACVSAGTCPAGQECLANRCVVAGGEPVSSDAQRLVAEPSAMSIVGSRSGRARELPPSVTFGSERDGTTTLYLRFPAVWRNAREIEAAFLVLEPLHGTLPASEDVRVTAWRVREQWTDAALEATRQPAVGLPSAPGIAKSAPPSVLRIDVTAIVDYLRRHPENDFGIALRSEDQSQSGSSYSTGASGGRAPRLEVYAR